jgi:hypothetical protein
VAPNLRNLAHQIDRLICGYYIAIPSAIGHHSIKEPTNLVETEHTITVRKWAGHITTILIDRFFIILTGCNTELYTFLAIKYRMSVASPYV